MPDPIQSVSNSSPYQPTDAELAAEDSSSLVCLAPPAQQPTANPSSPEANRAGTASPPAVASLVARFSPPTGAHPPVEPSFSKAAGHCAWELANAALDIGEVAKAGGDWISKAFAVGHALVNVGNAARCIQRDEAQQVAEGERLNQSADCVRDGAVPLLEPDGSVVCAAQ